MGDRVLTVRSSATAVTGEGTVESTTDTKRDRHVPVPEPIWKKLKAELPTDPNTLVFPRRKGGSYGSVSTAGHSTTRAQTSV
ncbi:hypothetical protein MHIB_05510 [Mycolicibacter hiberniae]|uniref:Uncharacterized protein n=1 Tax=Mycolicibacter hiberniae TaxID=29314 RepID=A0A7I7WZZ6_9MYCO|nr:hypothetical protein MHIB_05510 [Mycolicibacter hiberniae]